MTTLPVTRHVPELPGKRSALVVATSAYEDAGLPRLDSTARDAAEMADVLADPYIGAFQVTKILNKTAREVRVEMDTFLAGRSPDEMLLVYLSCHGLLDQQRRLYFAATDTQTDHLAATGVEARLLSDLLDDSNARSQVVVVDCCNSGAFDFAGSKGINDAARLVQERLTTEGRGRALLLSCRPNQPSWEGPAGGSVPAPSLFTGALVKGLRTGAADVDHDGYISVDEAYNYAFNEVISSGEGQVPRRSLSKAEGILKLARNPAGQTIVPAPLPPEFSAALSDQNPEIRMGAVKIMGKFLNSSDPTLALMASQALQRITETDVPAVAAAALNLMRTADNSPLVPASSPTEISAPAATPIELYFARVSDGPKAETAARPPVGIGGNNSLSGASLRAGQELNAGLAELQKQVMQTELAAAAEQAKYQELQLESDANNAAASSVAQTAQHKMQTNSKIFEGFDQIISGD